MALPVVCSSGFLLQYLLRVPGVVTLALLLPICCLKLLLLYGPAPGSVLLLSTHKHGAVISSTQLQLPNISPTAPFWSSGAAADAAMGIWDVSDFVKELGAEPATAVFVARFEPCLSPTCSKSAL